MDFQYAPALAPVPEIAAPAPLAGLWEQDTFGNGFLAEQLSESATTGFWNRHFPSIFGPEQTPEVARPGLDAVAQAADRTVAALELKDRFHVGEGAEAGKASVSQEEYDEIVALYSDIRRGKTQLKLDTAGLSEEDAAAFRQGTMGDLASMMQTPSGRALLAELAHGNNGHTTTLGHTAEDPDNEASLPGLDMNDVDDRWKLHNALHGGGGANSRVNYTPGKTVHTDHDGDIRSDVTLYHELTHAWHNGKGQNAQGSVPGANGTTVGLEEFETVGMGRYKDLPYTENRYRAERARMGEKMAPRATYGGTKPEEHGL